MVAFPLPAHMRAYPASDRIPPTDTDTHTHPPACPLLNKLQECPTTLMKQVFFQAGRNGVSGNERRAEETDRPQNVLSHDGTQGGAGLARMLFALALEVSADHSPTCSGSGAKG